MAVDLRGETRGIETNEKDHKRTELANYYVLRITFLLDINLPSAIPKLSH